MLKLGVEGWSGSFEVEVLNWSLTLKFWIWSFKLEVGSIAFEVMVTLGLVLVWMARCPEYGLMAPMNNRVKI